MKIPTLTVSLTHTGIVIACLLSTVGLADELAVSNQKPSIPEEVEQYSRELNIMSRSTNTNADVEGLLRSGRKVWRALVLPPPGSRNNVLGSLSEKDFQTVVLKMKGFFISREETYTIEPEPEFFLALAKRTGDQASVEFFNTYIKTEPNTWPVYIEQQTDYSGCIRYGTMSLVDTYTLWAAYNNKYPTRYTEEAMNFIQKVEDDFTGGTCACNDKDSVIREFKAFIQAFPSAKITARLGERINQIQQGKSDMREHCHSG